MAFAIQPPTEAEEVDGKMPKEVWLPETEEQVSKAMKLAYEQDWAVIPLGNGTKRHIGLPPSRYDVALKLRLFQGIVEYSPEDLVVIVKAGTTLSELQQTLNEHSQFLPLDPPFPEQATIGGIVATAMTGPCRCLYGSVREHLLGIKVVQPDGKVTRFGGKVVKNVAGYDVTKLYVGSFGTLGVIVEANFKVRPLPETKATLPVWANDLDTFEKLLSALVLSDIAPACAELLNAAAWEQTEIGSLLAMGGRYGLLLGFDGFREEVSWWLNETQKLAMNLGLKTGDVVEGDDELKVRSKIRDAHAGEKATSVLKAILPSSEVCGFAEKAQQLLGTKVAILAHSLNGIVRVLIHETFTETTVAAVNELLEHAFERSGNLMLEKAPTEWKERLPVWGKPTSAWKLMQRLKVTLDTKNLLSPSRLV
ncbi:MAG: FAD-binding oxidoreductase [Armatimonadetes bacterium]|nr:FAD-binding oxidoreductase [Armatimonadota bacterium]